MSFNLPCCITFLLPLFSKMLERVVFTTLFNHVQPVLAIQQHGFLPSRSCVTNLCTMLDSAWNNISAGSQTDIIYTDYSSAFQSVNHILLLHKLEKSYKITDKALKLLKSYLSGREQRVVVKGQCSSWTPVLSGTPEGGILSSLLFSCFINDLPSLVECKCLMFADDVKLYRRVDSVQDVAALQADLDKLCAWSADWGLTLNPAKCKVLTVTLRSKPVESAYGINGSEIDKVTSMRDLGVSLDTKLTFGSHIDEIISKANRALGFLIRSLQTGKHGRPLPLVDTKLLIGIYCAHVRSILEYGCVVWGGAAQTHLKRLEKIQHKFLIWLCGRCRITNISFEYKNLLQHFGLTSLAGRRTQYDLLFLRNLHNHKIDAPFLLECFPLAVPPRTLRNRVLFHVPHARVNTVKASLFGRIPRNCNVFLDKCRDVDIWHTTAAQFRARVIAYAAICD